MGDFEGRKQKLEELISNPPNPKPTVRKTNSPSTPIIIHSNLNAHDEFPDWYISVSFGRSSSKNFQKALALAKSSPKYIHFENGGQEIHQAVYSENSEDYLAFIQLYELVSNWKSSFTIINGELTDRKVVGGLNYCYGDKCRSVNTNFCFGESGLTSNPFGCHRLQVSAINNPWWTFSKQSGDLIAIDKQAIKERIDEFYRPYRCCPSFNYEDIIKRLNKLPNNLTLNQYAAIKSGTLSDASLYNIEKRENNYMPPLV